MPREPLASLMKRATTWYLIHSKLSLNCFTYSFIFCAYIYIYSSRTKFLGQSDQNGQYYILRDTIVLHSFIGFPFLIGGSQFDERASSLLWRNSGTNEEIL